MIKIPFEKATFAREMKPKLSGNNLSLEFENLESSFYKVAVDFHKYLSESVYNKIVGQDVNIAEEKRKTALDYLQRSMLHFSLYHHTIYLIANIGNDGITVKKNNDETTIFKYQQDQLENKLISDSWFWLNQLIEYLNKYEDDFIDWKNSEQKKGLTEIPITSSDFTKWVGVSDISFIIFAAWIMREVWDECILSRVKSEKFKSDKFAEIKQKMIQAFCYDVMSRACTVLAYYCLPEPIRVDINSEMGKTNSSQEDVRIREKVAKVFEQKALSYWNNVDSLIMSKKVVDAESNISTEIYTSKSSNESEKFVCS